MWGPFLEVELSVLLIVSAVFVKACSKLSAGLLAEELEGLEGLEGLHLRAEGLQGQQRKAEGPQLKAD